MTPPQVPLVSSRQAIAAFKRLGFEVLPGKGSHKRLVRARPDGGRDIGVILDGRREIPRPTLRSALAQTGVSVEEFIEAMR